MTPRRDTGSAGGSRLRVDYDRRTVLATLPYDVNRDTARRFVRLRTGQRVRVEGRMVSRTRIEVHRIR